MVIATDQVPDADADADAVRPLLRPTVRIGEVLHEGPSPRVFVTDTQTELYLRVGPREAFLLRLLDGTRGRVEVSRLHEQRYGRPLSETDWRALLASLAGRCLLEPSDPALVQRTAARVVAARRREGTSMLRRRFPVPGLHRSVPGAARAMGWLFHPTVALVASGAALLVCIWALAHVRTLVAVSATTQPRAGLAVVVVLVTAVVIALHEYGHGVACFRYGGMPQEMGILWRFPILAPYCKVDHVMVLPRRQRVMVSFAGTYVNLLALIPYTAVYLAAPEGSFARGIGAGLLLVGLPAALANLIPVLFLDGHRMIEHATGTYNLAASSWTAVGAVLARRREVLARYPRPVLRTCLGYAALALAVLTVSGVLLVRAWWTALDSWWGPQGATVFLLAEAVVIVLAVLVVRARRRRRRTG